MMKATTPADSRSSPGVPAATDVVCRGEPAPRLDARLKRMFEARSVAVIGASDDVGRIGGRPLAMLRSMGYDGAVYPISLHHPRIQGLPAFKSIGDIPHPVDLAICAVPAGQVEGVLQQCADLQVAGAVVFAGGFAEAGEPGKSMQLRLTRLAQRSGMRILGPNTLGFANLVQRLPASFHPAFKSRMPQGRMAIVSQSGAFAGLAAQMALDRGVGFRHVMATGNECDIGLTDCLDYLIGDPGTEVILLYVEGVRNGQAFARALAAAREARKPIVVVKVGRTSAGARAAQSHTSALAGQDAIYDAVFEQFGVWRASSIEEFFDVAAAISVAGLPSGNRVGLVTISGGVGVLMADDATVRGLDVAPLAEPLETAIKAIIPMAGATNPIDVTAQVVNEPQLLERVLELVLERSAYRSVVGFQGAALETPGQLAANVAMWHRLKRTHADRFLAVAHPMGSEARRQYESGGVPAFAEPTHATRAVAVAAYFSRAFDRESEPAAGGERVAGIPMDGNGEAAAFRFLAASGIPVVAHRLARSPDEAVAAALDLRLPVVLKIASRDIVHKTEVGGVCLGLQTQDAVRSSYDVMLDRVRAAAPQARIDGVLVAPMLAGGIETILGVHHDPVFGPVVMFGLGGIFVEALHDVVFRVAPFGVREAGRMIDSIRGRAILDGVRGAPPADVSALAAALSALSQVATRLGDRLVSLDINPFLVLPAGRGAMALDAMMEVRP